MDEFDLDKHLTDIDLSETKKENEDLEFQKSTQRVINLINAVASDEISRDLIVEEPNIDTCVNLDEVIGCIELNRQSLLSHVEEAINHKKEYLRANHQVELSQNRLLASNGEGQ